MVGHRRFLRALGASWVLAAALGLATPAPPVAAAPSSPTAPSPTGDPTGPDDDTDDDTDDGTDEPAEEEAEESPLRVSITSMSPASLPTDAEDVVVTGTVTNRTDEVWRSISLYLVDGGELPGASAEPMRTPGQLAAALDSPDDEVIGARVANVGEFGSVEELAPGASADYRITAPAAALQADETGVYWFGVHALGSSDSVPGDDVSDGRARTFLPVVPTRFDATPVTVSVVVPITRTLRHGADGTVAGSRDWAVDLERGRLSRLLDLVEAAPGPVSLLLDPAVVDAVGHLAAGNPPRSLGPAGSPEATPTPTGGTDETEGADESGGADPAEAVSGDDATAEVARVAARWLERLAAAAEGNQVLTLPYGNVDVAATVARDPDLLTLALAQRSTTLEDLGLETTPVVAPPNGYLDAASIAALDPDTRVLLADRVLGADAPVAADVDDHRVLLSAAGAAEGSPGPGPALTVVGTRQRLLAEAALRVVRSDREPMVVVLPPDGYLRDPFTFWSGLDAPWLDLATLSDLESATAPVDVAAGDLDYPEAQEQRELGPITVDGVADLVDAGDTLQNLLVDNTGIAGTITEEALSGLSYHVRYDQGAGRLATSRSRDWVAQRLGRVQVDAPNGVTLASDQGTFVVTLTNNLEQRVAVSLRARSDAGVDVTAPERVVLAPGARDTVRLTTRTRDSSVHNVELMVTDAAGAPLGSTSDVSIRSTQVGGVIWVIMGTGIAVLFAAIAVRLARRVAAARGGDPTAGSRKTRRRAAAAARRARQSGQSVQQPAQQTAEAP